MATDSLMRDARALHPQLSQVAPSTQAAVDARNAAPPSAPTVDSLVRVVEPAWNELQRTMHWPGNLTFMGGDRYGSPTDNFVQAVAKPLARRISKERQTEQLDWLLLQTHQGQPADLAPLFKQIGKAIAALPRATKDAYTARAREATAYGDDGQWRLAELDAGLNAKTKIDKDEVLERVITALTPGPFDGTAKAKSRRSEQTLRRDIGLFVAEDPGRLREISTALTRRIRARGLLNDAIALGKTELIDTLSEKVTAPRAIFAEEAEAWKSQLFKRCIEAKADVTEHYFTAALESLQGAESRPSYGGPIDYSQEAAPLLDGIMASRELAPARMLRFLQNTDDRADPGSLIRLSIARMIEHGWLDPLMRADRGKRSAVQAMEHAGLETNFVRHVSAVVAQRPDGWSAVNRALHGAPSIAQAVNAVRSSLSSDYAAFAFGLLVARAGEQLPEEATRAILRLVSIMGDADKQKAMRYLFDRPEHASKVAETFARIYKFNLRAGGTCEDTFSDFARAFLPSQVSQTDAVEAAIASAVNSVPEIAFDPATAEFFKAQGRTLFFRMPNGEIWCAKVPKRFAQEDELHYEAGMLIAAHSGLKDVLGWQSNPPTSLGMASLKLSRAMSDALVEQARIAGEKYIRAQEGKEVRAHFFKATADYWKYPADLSESELRRGLKVYHHDVGAAGEKGLYPKEVASFAHCQKYDRAGNIIANRSATYMWYVDLVGAGRGVAKGAGRLDKVELSMRFPNYGLGIRDYKQFVTLKGMQTQEPIHGAVVGFGNPLFASSLSVASWYAQCGRLSDGASIAALVRGNFVTQLAAQTKATEQACAAYMDACVDWAALGEQFSRYYATGPDAIWSQDGVNADAGPVNGPLPFTELVWATYCASVTAVALSAKDAFVPG